MRSFLSDVSKPTCRSKIRSSRARKSALGTGGRGGQLQTTQRARPTMMSNASSGTYPSPFIIFQTDNFKPESIATGSTGVLHNLSPERSAANAATSDWMLEFASPDSSAQDGSQAKASHVYGYTGPQTAAKDVDCVLVWDEATQVCDVVMFRSERCLRESDVFALAYTLRSASL